MDPYIGKFLDDRYEILDVLGTGGMAVVYRAYCHRLNRYVAVKILKSELAGDQELRRRFHDESQAVAMLSHPNIVAVYDVSQVDGREFIVMELIDGITLKQYMQKRGGRLNWREALHFINQILQGLKHAHSRGIIHRDIKPQNVMVLRDGSVKVTDFGIARSTTSQATVTQETIGSVHYISPEQAKGSHIDARSDLYSAGVVLYEMLTGRLPYEGDNPVSVAIQHINSIPIAPRELEPSIPLGMEQITMKAMANVPDRRYASAEQMLRDLDEFRRDPEIDFGYSALGVLTPDVDEPTVVRSRSYLEEAQEGDATVRSTSVRRTAARFEREEEPERGEDGYEDSSDDRKQNRRFILITAGVAVAVLVVFLLLWFTLFRGLFAKSASYSVPDLLGYTVEEAEELIESDEEISGHFTITVGEYEVSDEEVGTIIHQSPSSSRTVSADVTEITVTLSSGPEEEEQIVLEDYTDGTYDYREVKNILEGLGLTTTCTGEYSDDVDEYKVISTSPSAGAALSEGDAVTITYSLGPEEVEEETFSMVKLLGLTESDAKSTISTLGLTLSSVSSEYNDDYPSGRVCYQSIPENTTVTAGDAISIVISLGSEPAEEEEEPEQSSETTTTGTVTKVITVNMAADRTESSIVQITVNGSIYYQGSVSAEDSTLIVTYSGDTILSISVTVDGENYSDYGLADP